MARPSEELLVTTMLTFFAIALLLSNFDAMVHDVKAHEKQEKQELRHEEESTTWEMYTQTLHDLHILKVCNPGCPSCGRPFEAEYNLHLRPLLNKNMESTYV